MTTRISKATKEFNVSHATIIEFLQKQGFQVGDSPNAKLTEEQYVALKKEFSDDKNLRTEADKMFQTRNKEKKAHVEATKKVMPTHKEEIYKPESEKKVDIKTVGHIELDQNGIPVTHKEPTKKPEQDVEPMNTIVTSEESVHVEMVKSPKVMAEKSIEPSTINEPEESKPEEFIKDKEAEDLRKREDSIGKETDGVFRLRSNVEAPGLKVLGTIDLEAINASTHPKRKSKDDRRRERDNRNKPKNGATTSVAATSAPTEKRKRTRIGNERIDITAAAQQVGNNKGTTSVNKTNNNATRNNNPNRNTNNLTANNRKKERNNRKSPIVKPELSEEDVAKQVKETLARLTSKNKVNKGAKYRKEKRESMRDKLNEQLREQNAESKILKLTEFVSANELASMMDVPVTQVIATCMSIGIMVSINQRLDAETINIVAEEFGYNTEYVSADVADAIIEDEDNEEDLIARAPIVTVMGHVDHGKTSLLDYIRKANVIAGEAGGITQHIGAYNVTLEDGRHITFLDTPGHEAFTAMRARGAQATDIAIIIIAADDDIMPQTKEAINHAVAANVPIVFAINKVDKPAANPEKIKEGLANMNFLVEDWGGKYQSQDISAKQGLGVKELLEKVLLEAEMLELRANPNRKATGMVIESSLDKGRGYVANILVSNGTLRQGDIVLAGPHYGRVKALFNERNQRVMQVAPAEAGLLLGFNGAPQAGDIFHVIESEQEAKELANKRKQLQQEQGLRTQKILTLDEVGRRIALGSFQELNIIVKGDVDGSIEALSDTLIKMSTEKIAVNVISKGVGQISENDIALAAASNAIIIGFQVRPSIAARKAAEQHGVDIRLYSIIYDAVEEVRDAMEGMLAPVIKEEVTATLEIRMVYNISKVGLVAGSYVIDGRVKRSDKARLIRDGIVIFTGEINALKRFKDDVKEVTTNFECGISLAGCNDMKEGDTIETYQEIAVKQKL